MKNKQCLPPPFPFSALTFFFFPVLDVLGPVPPFHTPVMASLLIRSALACLWLWGRQFFSLPQSWSQPDTG